MKHRIYKLNITPKRYKLLIRFTLDKDKMYIRSAIHQIGNKRIAIEDFFLPAKESKAQMLGFSLTDNHKEVR